MTYDAGATQRPELPEFQENTVRERDREPRRALKMESARLLKRRQDTQRHRGIAKHRGQEVAMVAALSRNEASG